MEPTIEKKSNGALVGIVIIVIILIIGGIYMWMTKASKLMQREEIKNENENTITENITIETENSPSTEDTYNELNQIEQDLNQNDTNLEVDVKEIQ